jgi:hypothetical protein
MQEGPTMETLLAKVATPVTCRRNGLLLHRDLNLSKAWSPKLKV